RAADQDPRRRARLAGLVSTDVASQDLVPVSECPCQSPGNGAGHGSAERAERQRVLDCVFHKASFGAIGLDPMDMIPECERSFPLDIAELPVLFVIAMFRDPALPPKAHGNLEYGTRTVFNASGSLQYLRGLPGRVIAIKGARPLMPGKDLR